MTDAACSAVGRLLGAHLDGQLDTVKTLEVEDHLASCETCRERVALDRALRGSLKKAVKTSTPDDVRARMLAAMAGETARAEKADGAERTSRAPEALTSERPGRGMLRHWRTMLPLASAAALALAWGAASNQPVAGGTADLMKAGFGNDELLHDFVAQHSRAYPPERTDPTEVRQLSRYVGVPVRVPRFQPNARFLGGRLVPVHGGEAAAMLQYEVEQKDRGVQRVTVFVYNPRNVQVGGAHLAPRAVGTAEVRVGRTDGYSVAVAQHGGVGYAIASDLDPDSNANLVAVVDRDRD